MRNSYYLVLIAAVLMIVAGCASETKFYGDAKIDGGRETCEIQCKKKSLIFSGMVTLGEYSDGCLCTTQTSSRELRSAGLDQIKTLLEEEQDSLSNLSEVTQIRLQMYMDRRHKAIKMLYNMMKSSSDTQSDIIHNIK
ncbi:MAG: hypothetical protein JST80_05230 [Bdellovibrionales bacterium]|nr:hypothetical protein [Bdellovibrionales bacterium]